MHLFFSATLRVAHRGVAVGVAAPPFGFTCLNAILGPVVFPRGRLHPRRFTRSGRGVVRRRAVRRHTSVFRHSSRRLALFGAWYRRAACLVPVSGAAASCALFAPRDSSRKARILDRFCVRASTEDAGARRAQICANIDLVHSTRRLHSIAMCHYRRCSCPYSTFCEIRRCERAFLLAGSFFRRREPS